ncbi:Ig domain-containing protein [Aquimarina sp. RZ0]|uniref:Ig domain-containing protein n=1 Tax=Aquimarina sp. RZ0 TaxID=2607730 RepID=UPI0011F30ED7|nr:Ig domain-containing protein [Aquimarina sp. RZ0]KAA1246668.1 Ig domain-containing protein [Aquimarina sp. RZ0]
MKQIKRITVLSTVLSILCLLSISCSQEDILEEKLNESSFYLKNVDGSLIDKIEPELISPIYEDLKSNGKINEAVSFLKNYNDKGKYIGDVSDVDIVKASNPSFYYGVHLQNTGWIYGNDSSVDVTPSYYTFGTTGEHRRLEAFYLILNNTNICYESHLQNIGWNQGVSCNGSITGTTGESRRMEAIKISLDSGVGFVLYQAHLAGTGWESGWAYNGDVSGTIGQSRRLEAFRLRFLLY